MLVVGDIDCMVECESSMRTGKDNYSYHLTDRGNVTMHTSILTWQVMLVWCILWAFKFFVQAINTKEKSTSHFVSGELSNTFSHKDALSASLHWQLEALRERRPPWPRQIITPILPTAKMLSLGGERLPPPPAHPPPPKKKRIITCTTIWVCHYYYGGFFCSFTHLKIPRSPPKFNQFVIVLPRTPP